MSGSDGLRKYIWKGKEKEKREKNKERRRRRLSHTPSPHRTPRHSPYRSPRQSPYRSLRQSPYRSPRQSPYRSPRQSPYRSPRHSPRLSPRPSPLLSTRPSPLLTTHLSRKRRRKQWRLPTFLRKNDKRRSGPSGGAAPLDTSLGGVAVTSQSLQDPLVYRNPYLASFSDPLRGSSRSIGRHLGIQYFEPEIHDVGTIREPKYLDLFDPAIQVVRDPKLDQPRRTWKDRLRPILSTNLGAVPTKFFVGFCVVFVFVIIGIAAIVTVAKLLKLPPEDPRISFPFVTTATSCGLVTGLIENECYVFRGIPFALPPEKELRLRPAKIPNAVDHCWMGNYSANISRPCWAYDLQGAIVSGFEDCLLLDVFTPKLGYENPLPVVVYVGGSSLGSDSQRSYLMSRAPIMSMEKQFVLVYPQIRRGLLGFFPSPIVAASSYPHTSGNQGASDLMAALVWVNHNIEHFGGDKHKVTLLGHQAGAALSWPMIARARAKNLLHSAWLTGAAPVQPKVLWRKAHESLGRPLSCTNVACIDEKSAHEIMDAITLEWRRSNGRPWLHGDGVYIPIDEEFPQVPIMFGTTEQTAAEYLMPWRNRLSTQKDMEETITKIFQEIMVFNPIAPEGPLEIRPPNTPPKKIPKLYDTDDASKALEHYSSFMDNPWLLLTTLVSDAFTTCPLLNSAAMLARKWDHSIPSSRKFSTPIYSYVSQHQRGSSFGGIADGQSDIEAILGVFRSQSRSDINFASTIQNLFYTFIETGSPERFYPTSAHHGIYVLKEDFSIERDRRRWCDHWTNFSHLVRTF